MVRAVAAVERRRVVPALLDVIRYDGTNADEVSALLGTDSWLVHGIGGHVPRAGDYLYRDVSTGKRGFMSPRGLDHLTEPAG